MNITQNQQNKMYDTDRLSAALQQHMGRRCIDVGYQFNLWGKPSYDNITLIYIRNYGNNIEWFNVITPGRTIITPLLIGRISSLKMDVPLDFRSSPNTRKIG